MAGAAALAAVPLRAQAAEGVRARRLTVEHVADPLGIDVGVPRFSWQLAASGTGRAQSAYRLVVASRPEKLGAPDVWDSGKVRSGEQTAQVYAGPPLRSRTRYHWAVEVWDEAGRPGQAGAAWFETAMLADGDWSADWIGTGAVVAPPVQVLPPRQFTAVPLDAGHTLGQTFRADGPHTGFTVLLKVDGTARCVMSLRQDGPQGTVVAEKVLDGLTGDRYGQAHGRLDFPQPLEPGAYYLELSAGQGNLGWYGLSYNAYPEGTAHVDGVPQTGDRWLCGIPPAPPADPLLRDEFDLPAPVASARLYLAGLGHAIAWVNGGRVGDGELSPPATDFDVRSLYTTHDVTALLHQGRNALGIALGRGFFSTRAADTDGSDRARWIAEPRVKAQLEVRLTDGRAVTVTTSPDWLLTEGPTTSDGVYAGESYDARRARALVGWSSPGFDTTGWRPATRVDGPGGRLEAYAGEPVRAGGVIRPKNATRHGDTWLYDFGVLLSGWTTFTSQLPEGATIRLLHSEKLGASGRIETQTPGGLENAMVDGRFQLDEYTAAGTTETWRPSFTYKGFRYVEVTGAPGRLDLAAVPLHNDVADTMDIKVEHPVLQWIADAFHQTALNGLRGQLEPSAMYSKLGWTSSTYRAAQPLLYQFGVAAVMGKWLDDVRLGQAPDGEIPLISPMGTVAGGGLLTPSSTGVYPFLVRRYWLAYGDRTVPEKHYEPVKRYVGWLLGKLDDDIADDVFGDWYPPRPGDTPGPPEGNKLVGTAYVIRTLRDAIALAELLGDTAQVTAWSGRADGITRRFNEVFLDGDTYRTEIPTAYRQTSNAVPLAFGLVPAERVRAVAARLAAEVEATRHLDTGALGVGALPYALSDHGRADLAHLVLGQRDYPSYGYLRDLGATTFWESWEADSRGHNDPTISSPVSWLVERVVGVEPLEPGWARFRVAPTPVLPSASAALDTVRGRVDVSWRRDGGTLALDVRVPVNAVAEVVLPNGARRLGSGHHRLTSPVG
jgi:alpha-L-rhamnosidase